MMKKALWSFLSIFVLVFILQACKNNSTKISDSNNKHVAQSQFAQNYPFFDPQVLRSRVEEQLAKDSILQPLFAGREYKLLWINDTLNTDHLSSFINVLVQSREHGLPSHLFNDSLIVSLVDSISSGAFKDSTLLYNKLVTLELSSAHIINTYVKGMTYGFVRPQKLYKKDFAIKLNSPDSIFYDNLYRQIVIDPIVAMQQSEPQDTIYKSVLAEYKNLLDHDDWKFPKIQEIGAYNYKLGTKNKNIEAIAKRLIITGEFVPPTSNDSISVDSLSISLQELTPELMAAINKFRQKNSLPIDDNEVGDATVKALNKPLDYYKTKLRANLERYRWRKIKQPAKKHIEVNVAAFMLFAFQEDSIPLAIKVCVGRSTHKSPMLESDISYINLNPKWNVPVSIAKDEISVLQQKDPTYIARHNMKLYKGGKEVDPSSIDWVTTNPARRGYTFVQGSGAGNALGRLKFMFNNDFSVYLHDTPSRAAFGRINRAVSHGCIRVQHPLELAYFITDANDLYKDRIRYSIGYEPTTKQGRQALNNNRLTKLSDIISLTKDNPVTIFIDYFTVYQNPIDNNLYYVDDIYDYDSAILQELRKIKI